MTQNLTFELWRSRDNGITFTNPDESLPPLYEQYFYSSKINSRVDSMNRWNWESLPNFSLGNSVQYKVRAKQSNTLNGKIYFSEFSNILLVPTNFEAISCNSSTIKILPISFKGYEMYNLYNDNTAAISTCNNLVRYGFSDWYLPSKDEVDCVYANKNTLYNSSSYQREWWSSTESGASAYSKDFITGASKLESKTMTKAFFCVRK